MLPTIYMILHFKSQFDASQTYDLFAKIKQVIKCETQGGELAIDLTDSLIYEINHSQTRPYLKLLMDE